MRYYSFDYLSFRWKVIPCLSQFGPSDHSALCCWNKCLTSVHPTVAQRSVRKDKWRETEMCVTSGIVPAVTYPWMCAHTNTINSSSWNFSNVRVNQTQLWHQVRNLKDNRRSVRVWNVKDNADIFDFETYPRDRAITQKRWLLLSPYWDNCCAHEKLDEDVFILVTSDWHITTFIITSEVYDEL